MIAMETHLILRICVILMTPIQVHANRNGTVEYHELDMLYIDHSFTTHNADSVLKCCAVCTSNPDCASVSLKTTDNICSLNDHNPDDYPTARTFVSTDYVSYHIIARCASGWIPYDRNCYLVVLATKSWSDAEDHCQSLDSHLVTIRDGDEDNFVFNAVLAAGVHFGKIWIGLNDIEAEGSYISTDGSTFPYTCFDDDEPNGFTSENCITIRMEYNGLWNDASCSKYARSVCKRKNY